MSKILEIILFTVFPRINVAPESQNNSKINTALDRSRVPCGVYSNIEKKNYSAIQ